MSRGYTSAVRAEQAEATRQRIVDAAVERLAEGGSGWSMQDVADAAGTSVRTVYRHFASRDDLVDGVLAWVNDVILARRPTGELTSPDDLAAVAPAAFAFIYEHERVYRALLLSEWGRARHRLTARRREEELRHALTEELAGLDLGAQRRLLGVMHALASSQAALLLRDYWGLDAGDAGRAVGWAVRVLAAAAADPAWKGEL